MTTIQEYRFTNELHQEFNKTLVRAVDAATGKTVILKITPFHGGLDSASQEFDQEFAFGSSFAFSRILNYNRMLRPENYLAIEMDDFEGCSLQTFLAEKSLSIQSALSIAFSLTQTVEELQYHEIA